MNESLAKNTWKFRNTYERMCLEHIALRLPDDEPFKSFNACWASSIKLHEFVNNLEEESQFNPCLIVVGGEESLQICITRLPEEKENARKLTGYLWYPFPFKKLLRSHPQRPLQNTN